MMMRKTKGNGLPARSDATDDDDGGNEEKMMIVGGQVFIQKG